MLSGWFISVRVCQPDCQRFASCNCLALIQKRTVGSQEATNSAKTHWPRFWRLTTWKCRQPHVFCFAVHFDPKRWGYFCFLGIKVKTSEFGIGWNPYIILVCPPDSFPGAIDSMTNWKKASRTKVKLSGRLSAPQFWLITAPNTNQNPLHLYLFGIGCNWLIFLIGGLESDDFSFLVETF